MDLSQSGGDRARDLSTEDQRTLEERLEDSLDGAVLILTDGQRFVMQRKDSLHPVMRCRGCLSFFGGSLENGEDAARGLSRELHEEFADSAVADEVTSIARYWKWFELPGNQFPKPYGCHLFLAETDPIQLDGWIGKLEADGGVLEGELAVLDRSFLLLIAHDTDNFVGSLDVPLREYLGC